MVNTLNMDALCACGHSLAYHPMEESCNSCHGACEAFRSGGAPEPVIASDLPPVARRMLAELETPEVTDGYWLVHHGEALDIAVFPDEVDALRYAVRNRMLADFREWGPVGGVDQ